MICAACRRARPDDELLAFWPVGDPHRLRHVCRPSLNLPGPSAGRGSCFASVVSIATVHEIALAAPSAPVELARPIRPGTRAWRSLLESAGVRLDRLEIVQGARALESLHRARVAA